MIDLNTDVTVMSGGSGDTPGKIWRPLREVTPVDTTVDQITQLQRKVATLSETTSEIVSQSLVNQPDSDPMQVSGVSATESPYKTPSGQLLSLVAVDFTPDPTDTPFVGAEVWFTGYNGATTPQLMAAGSSSPIQFLCETTHEEVVVTVVAYHADGKTTDFGTAPTTTVSLDGVSSAPPAPSIAQAQVALPGNSGWQFSFNVLSGLESDLIDGYWIYHSQSSSAPTAPTGRFQYIKQSATNIGTVTIQENTQDIVFYWVSAVNIGGQESTLTAVPFTYIDQGQASPPAPSAVNTTRNFTPGLSLNGWGSNAHVGNYEGGGGLGSEVFGLNAAATLTYTSIGNVTDATDTSRASYQGSHTHAYAGAVWAFSGIAYPGGTTITSVALKILSEVFTVNNTLAGHADVWYSLNGGSTWTAIYKAYGTRFKQWDTITLSTSQNLNNIQVMVFSDSHDNVGHGVYTVVLEVASSGYNGPEKVTGVSTALVSGNVLVTFNALVPVSRTDITQYEVYRALRGNGYSFSVLKNTITPTGATTYSWSDSSGHDSTWEYYVLARTANGYSAPSDAAFLHDANSVLYPGGTPVSALQPAEAGATLGATWGANVSHQPQDLHNLIVHPTFEDNSLGNWSGPDSVQAVTGQTFAKVAVCSTRDCVELNNSFPVTPGDKLFCSGTVNTGGLSGHPVDGDTWNAGIGVEFFDKSGSLVAFVGGASQSPGVSAYTPISGWLTAPAGSVTGRPWLQIDRGTVNPSYTCRWAQLFIARFESGAEVTTGKSLTVLVDRHLGNVADDPGGSRAAWDSAAQKGAAVDSSGNLKLKNKANADGSTSSPTTSSSTYATVPELTQTITTLGNKVLVIFICAFNVFTGAGNGVGWFAIFRDGVQVSKDYKAGIISSQGAAVTGSFIDTPSAGSHTYTIQWRIATGGVYTITADGANRSLQIVELG